MVTDKEKWHEEKKIFFSHIALQTREYRTSRLWVMGELIRLRHWRFYLQLPRGGTFAPTSDSITLILLVLPGAREEFAEPLPNSDGGVPPGNPSISIPVHCGKPFKNTPHAPLPRFKMHLVFSFKNKIKRSGVIRGKSLVSWNPSSTRYVLNSHKCCILQPLSLAKWTGTLMSTICCFKAFL